MKISEISKALVLSLVLSLTALIVPISAAQAVGEVDVRVQIEGPSAQDLNGYALYVYDENFDFVTERTVSGEVEGILTLALSPGSYTAELYPFDAVAGTSEQHKTIAPASFRIVVTSSVSVSVSKLGAGAAQVAEASGVFTLQASSASVHGRVFAPDTASIVVNSEQGVNVILEKESESGFMPTAVFNSDFIKADGSFALALADSGTYRLWLYPYGLEEFAESKTATFSYVVGDALVNLGDFTLAVGNIAGTLIFPDGSPAQYTSLYVEDQASQIRSYTSTNQNGEWVLNVTEDGDYFLVAEPPYRSTGFAQSQPISFSVVAGAITVEGGLDPLDLQLSLREPNVLIEVRATVSGVLVPVADAWVSLSDDNYATQRNSQTAASGNAEFFLDQTSSPIATNIWIGSNPEFADAFMNLNTTITSDMFRQVDGKSVVTLVLQEPNLSFSVADSSGETLPYATVIASLGNWYLFGYSDENGDVRLNVDVVEIAAENPGLAGSHSISLTVMPPYGSSDVSELRCDAQSQHALCVAIPSVTIGTDFQSTKLESPFRLPAPNTKILVKAPNGNPIGAGAWVALMVTSENNGFTSTQYLTGAMTDDQGFAGLNVDTASYTVSFSVEVFPPWDSDADLAPARYEVSVYAGLTAVNGFALAAPNLFINVQEPGSTTPSKWSYAIAIERDSNGNFVDFLGGSGANQDGEIKLSLPTSTTVSLTVFPGPLSSAATTECEVFVNAESVVSIISCSAGSTVQENGDLLLKLSSGNVTGRVSTSTSAGISGALVIASNGSSTISATTDANGDYGLQLDFPGTWNIEVFYTPDDPGILGYLNGGSVTTSGPKNLQL